MQPFENDQKNNNILEYFEHKSEVPQLPFPMLRDEPLFAHTMPLLKAIPQPQLDQVSRKAPGPDNRDITQEIYAWSDSTTWILPVVTPQQDTLIIKILQPELAKKESGYFADLHKLVKNSGIYALASIATPLISLILTPFLTHNLSPTDFGILAVANTTISLCAGVAQLGLASAFFRAYGYDYTSSRDKRDVVATTTTILGITAICTVLLVLVFASPLAFILFGQSSAVLTNVVILSSMVVLLQNLTAPVLALLRAEERPLTFSLLSTSNTVITLLGTVLLVGVLHRGISGAILANGAGYAFVVVCTLPIILLRVGLKIRIDIARSMLAFGLPLVLNFLSFRVLQVSDRYLLSFFVSLAETARYAVAYTVGSAVSIIIMGPFSLAWPTALFAIAKREDAANIFRTFFRWFSLLFFFITFALSMFGTTLLDWVFPATYHSTAFIIPIVAESVVFFGVYSVFLVGVNIKRKTWMISIFSTIAAIINVLLNLLLIPHYGSGGAALSTLLAYIILAAVAYVVNQRLYPIPFEIGLFIIAQLIGLVLYAGVILLLTVQDAFITFIVHFSVLLLYGGCLGILGILPKWKQKRRIRLER